MTNRDKQLAELNKILGAVASIDKSKWEDESESESERQEREKWENVDREWDERFD